MADEVAQKIAEAKKKMFGNQQPSGGKIITFVTGEGQVKSSDKRIEVRRQ